jgi:hypothetical protein
VRVLRLYSQDTFALVEEHGKRRKQSLREPRGRGAGKELELVERS